MAEKERDRDEEESSQEEPKKGGSKKLIIIGAVVVLVLVGVGAFFALSGSKGDPGALGAEGGGKFDKSLLNQLPGALYPMDTFIVNLQVKGSFLKTDIQLEFIEPELPPYVNNEIPRMRDSIIRVLSSKAASEILSVEGKQKLREDLIDALNDTLGGEEIVQVYFTDFIVQ